MIDIETSSDELRSTDHLYLELDNYPNCMICLESLVTPTLDTTSHTTLDTTLDTTVDTTVDTAELWTCPQCSKEFHKECIKNWIRSRPRKHFICPHCNYIVAKYNRNNRGMYLIRQPNQIITENYYYERLQNFIHTCICLLLVAIIFTFIWYIIKENDL